MNFTVTDPSGAKSVPETDKGSLQPPSDLETTTSSNPVQGAEKNSEMNTTSILSQIFQMLHDTESITNGNPEWIETVEGLKNKLDRQLWVDPEKKKALDKRWEKASKGRSLKLSEEMSQAACDIPSIEQSKESSAEESNGKSVIALEREPEEEREKRYGALDDIQRIWLERHLTPQLNKIDTAIAKSRESVKLGKLEAEGGVSHSSPPSIAVSGSSISATSPAGQSIGKTSLENKDGSTTRPLGHIGPGSSSGRKERLISPKKLFRKLSRPRSP